MIILITLFSFILEFLFNSIFYNTLFIPLCVICVLVLVEPFFNKNKFGYLVYSFLIGLFYDFIFTGNYFFSAGLFLLIGLIIIFINKITPNNFLITLFELVLFVCFYRLICFLFFSLFSIALFDFNILFKSIYSSLLFNIIFGALLYFIMNFISKKFNISRIN